MDIFSLPFSADGWWRLLAYSPNC